MNKANHKETKTVLFAVDGSEHSLSALRLLLDLQLSKGSGLKYHVYVLGVLTPLQASDHTIHLVPIEQAEIMLSDAGIDVTAELLLGYPAEMISNKAEEMNADLIVIGAKGLRATLGILLGGVAQQIVEYACCPTLVVRAPYKGLNRILMVTDGSIYSQSAIEYISQFPFPAEASIYVAHVLPPDPIPESIGADIVEVEETIRAEQELEGKKVLDKACESLSSSSIQAECVLLRGDAATEVINFVKKNSIDLIVCGSRGLSQVRSWLLGSVSRKLVHYADCSVLIVKNDH
jgi:nucleotide-binding universal stress UspA family protein